MTSKLLECVEGCTYCGWRAEPGVVVEEDLCPECKRQGTMSSFYGPDEWQENELTQEELNALGFVDFKAGVTECACGARMPLQDCRCEL